MAKSLYIIDGHAQIYRAFYAPFRELNSPTGEPTKATHVFCQMLFNLIRDRRPDYLALALDVSDGTVFRCDIDPNYKANRDPAPEELHVQVDRIVAIVEVMGIPILRVPGFEADDVMATVAHRMDSQDIEVFLVSKDKDLEQLITENVFLYDVNKDVVIDEAGLFESKGYTPAQVVEVQTLAGDSTDNIPGVQGVGVKTAAKLINQYGSAEAVLANADKLTPKMSERVKAFASQIAITRQLVTLRRDVPMEFSLEACQTSAFTLVAAKPIFSELGFNRLLDVADSMAALTSGEPSPQMPARPDVAAGQYHLVDTTEKLAALVAQLNQQQTFAFDTETTGLNPVTVDLVGLSFCWRAGEACYIPVRAAVGATLSQDEVAKALKPVFENPSIQKVGHNLRYDALVIRQIGIRLAGEFFDTMIASFLLDPMRPGHSLDGLSKSLLGHDMVPISDLIGKGRDQVTIDQIDAARVCEYASEDADFTWQLKELLEPKMIGSPVEKLFREIESPLIEVLVELSHNGIALNTDLLGDLSKTMALRIGELEAQIQHEAGSKFNVNSTKQLAVVLFDELGLPVIKKTKTGRSTDAQSLQAIVEKTDHLIPKLVLEYRELTKLRGTYVDTLPKMVFARTGRVHASFHQSGVATGRLSSSDPNLQNIPIRTETGRQIRRAFIAGDPDSVLLAADYSQIELRLLAHFCNDEALVNAFQSGQDIHRAVAAQVNGVELDEVTSEQRSAAKAVNFGIIYGQSAFGLSRTLGIPMGEAKMFIDMYFLRYPGIRLFIDKCVDDARTKGYAETILGRRRPIPELQSRNRQQVGFGERIAVNTVVQGSAADLIKRAMIDIHHELMGSHHSAKMLIQVHDELVFEVPESDVETEAKMIRQKMEHAFELSVPIVVDVAWGKSWADSKS